MRGEQRRLRSLFTARRDGMPLLGPVAGGGFQAVAGAESPLSDPAGALRLRRAAPAPQKASPVRENRTVGSMSGER